MNSKIPDEIVSIRTPIFNFSSQFISYLFLLLQRMVKSAAPLTTLFPKITIGKKLSQILILCEFKFNNAKTSR
jgi:hypothetical protein